MITLEDCTAFCDAPEPDVARIAREHRLTMVAALACAHARHVADAERGRERPHRARKFAAAAGGKPRSAHAMVA